jgi:MFS family permease
VLGEVWALALAPPAKRGRVMGVFNAVMGAGYAVGPLTLTLVGVQGWPPFLIAIGGFLACGAILHLVSAGLAGFEGESGHVNNVLGFAKIAPALLAAVLSSSAVQQSTYALTPVFGAAYGIQEAVLASLISALSIGNIVLQIPLGLAAERVGGRAMILFCALATACCAALLPILILTPAVWPLLVVMGAVGYGVYTMALVELGDRFSGQTLVTGNAAFALMWGAGGIVGPPTTGALMQAVGPLGLPAVIAGLSALLSAFVIYRSATRRRS